MISIRPQGPSLLFNGVRWDLLCKGILWGTHPLSLLSTLFSLYRLGLVLFLNTGTNYADAAKIRMLQKLEFCHYLLADVQLNL